MCPRTTISGLRTRSWPRTEAVPWGLLPVTLPARGGVTGSRPHDPTLEEHIKDKDLQPNPDEDDATQD